ncbi:DUF6350 family protein [Demequina sp. NBRC 110052]|uniref:cell division protein PerM n=1 Tax=Demequina sp. NBRC 110052 TaxID=1570341 RepID=UPI000A007482|nr:DUF6350 family protein [Demequina sp. NBRC 110052]
MTASTSLRSRLRGLADALPGWASGLVTGALAALVSLMAVIAPALAAVAAAPTPTGTGTVDWSAGAAIASKLWLLAHGVPVETDLAAFTLVPLGLSLVCLTVLVATAQRFLDRSWVAVALAVASYAFVVGSVAALVWAGTPDGSDLITRAVVGAFVLAVPGAVIGRVRAHGLTVDALELVPAPVRVGTRIAAASVALALGVAALVAIAWAVAGRHTMAETATGLGVDGVGGVVLALGETAYAPTLVVWALAWLTGLGFRIGDDTLWAPSQLLTGDLPEVPLLGALPTASGGPLVWAPLLLVAVGAIARVAMHRRIPAWRADAAVLVAEVVAATLMTAALAGLASGAIGPGRLAVTGPDAWAVGLAAGLLIGAGHLLVLLATAVSRAFAPEPQVRPRSSSALRQAAPRSGAQPTRAREVSPAARTSSAPARAPHEPERDPEPEAAPQTAGTAASAAARFRRDERDGDD